VSVRLTRAGTLARQGFPGTSRPPVARPGAHAAAERQPANAPPPGRAGGLAGPVLDPL